MDLLDFLTDEELIRFLQCNKTEITSYIEKPLTFLNQLRDNKLVPENLYQKVKKMKNKPKGVYEILEWVENKPGQHVRKFWRHLFQNHILREYRRLRGLKKRLLDGTFRISEKLPNAETPSSNTEVERKKKKQEQKKGATKRKKIVEETDEELPGPSSASSQKKQAVKPPLCCVQIAINLPDAETPSSNMTVDRKKKKQEQNKGATKRKKSGKETHEMERGPSSVSNRKKLAMNLKLSKHLKKGELPVICRDKEGTLYKDKLARGEKCILSKGVLYTPGDFERFSGREKSKNWKLSIRCENITLHELIQAGKLQCRYMKARRK